MHSCSSGDRLETGNVAGRSNSTNSTIRQRKKRETRKAISRAALRLALEHGPEAVTVEAISQEADVSPRTIFNYFASKEDAILGVDPTHAQRLEERFAARPIDEAPLRSLRSVLLDASEELSADIGEWRQRLQLVRQYPSSLFAAHAARFTANESALIRLVALRLNVNPANDLRPALLVSAALAALRSATDVWETSDRAVQLEALIEQAFSLLETGLRSVDSPEAEGSTSPGPSKP